MAVGMEGMDSCPEIEDAMPAVPGDALPELPECAFAEVSVCMALTCACAWACICSGLSFCDANGLPRLLYSFVKMVKRPYVPVRSLQGSLSSGLRPKPTQRYDAKTSRFKVFKNCRLHMTPSAVSNHSIQWDEDASPTVLIREEYFSTKCRRLDPPLEPPVDFAGEAAKACAPIGAGIRPAMPPPRFAGACPAPGKGTALCMGAGNGTAGGPPSARKNCHGLGTGPGCGPPKTGGTNGTIASPGPGGFG